MKTITLTSAHSVARIIVLQVVLICSLALQTLSAQSATLVSQPTPANVQSSSSALGFQALSFPLSNAQKVRVIFEDPTGNGAVIQVRDAKGEILHSQSCFRKKVFVGNFDISALPDGPYSVAIIALTKAGFKQQTFVHSFRMETETNRSLKPVEKTPAKETVTAKQ